jgi:hypothetical protein
MGERVHVRRQAQQFGEEVFEEDVTELGSREKDEVGGG